jgi:hypothetical protein
MAITNLKEFLARQLNDHCESPAGIVKKTFYEWGEGHICDAVNLAMCYVYSLIPQDFTTTETLVLKADTKIVDFSSVCEKYTAFICLELPNGDIAEVTEKDAAVRDLMPLLANKCTTSSSSSNPESFTFDNVDGSKDILLFKPAVPAGSKIMFSCAKAPSADSITDDQLCQYGPLIAEYALWWLFRTDSESRSSLERAKLHYQAISDFVTTKLLLEFSLDEDDYNYGRLKKADD